VLADFYGALCALSLVLPAQPQIAGAPRLSGGPPLQANMYGAPVRTQAGLPITYDEAQTALQHQAWLSAGSPGDEQGPLGGCESSVVEADWKYFAFGTGLGAGGMAISEVAGKTQLILTAGGGGFGGGKYWMILERGDDAQGYVQRFVSPVYSTTGVRRLETAQIDADASPEVVVLLSNGLVQVWDQAEQELQDDFPTVANVVAMRVRDIDQDGVPEVLLATESSLRVHAADGALKWTAPVGGSDLAVGQMDADPALEIALTSGNVVDAATHAVQWNWAAGFGSFLEAGDFDGDGMDELIGTQAWSLAWSYDVDKQLPKWSLPIFNVGATNLTDADGDGSLEFLIGEAQWGDILGIDPVTLVTEFSIPNPEHGTTDVVVGDCDADGEPEVVWGAGHSSSGSDHVFVADLQSEQIEWQSVHLDGPFRAPARGDVDGDGIDELVSVTNESDAGYGAGRILVFDLELELQAISQDVGNGLGWSGTHEVVLRNVDADPALEIVVATSTTYDGTIEIYDWNGAGTFTRIWEVPNPKPAGAFVSAEVIDLDGDGQLEVVGVAGQYAYSYGLASKLEEWQSLAVVGNVAGMAIADTDEDSSLEVVVLGLDGDLRIFDGQSGALEAWLVGSYSCVEVTPMVVLPDLLRLGTSTGKLVTLQHQAGSYGQVSSVDLVDGGVESLSFGNGETLWVGSEGTFTLHFPPYTAAFWESCSVYGAPFGGAMVYGADHVLTAGLNGLVAFRRHPGD
jgi:hypothetical protein